MPWKSFKTNAGSSVGNARRETEAIPVLSAVGYAILGNRKCTKESHARTRGQPTVDKMKKTKKKRPLKLMMEWEQNLISVDRSDTDGGREVCAVWIGMNVP